MGCIKIQKIFKLGLPLSADMLLENDNLLNFEMYVMFRQTQHDIHFKILIQPLKKNCYLFVHFHFSCIHCFFYFIHHRIHIYIF